MNKKFFAAALIAATGFAAAPSFAGGNMTDEVGYVQPLPTATSSSLTRADVVNEYLQARRDNTLENLAEGADDRAVAATQSTVTRAAVRAEAAYALRHGQIVSGEV